MTRATAIRIMTEHVESLKEQLGLMNNTTRIKRTEARIDAMELALEEMHRLEGLEK